MAGGTRLQRQTLARPDAPGGFLQTLEKFHGCAASDDERRGHVHNRASQNLKAETDRSRQIRGAPTPAREEDASNERNAGQQRRRDGGNESREWHTYASTHNDDAPDGVPAKSDANAEARRNRAKEVAQ